MPLSKYFHGSGEEVMANMQQEYGAEKGKRVFYATANSRDESHAKRSFSKAKRRHELKRKVKHEE